MTESEWNALFHSKPSSFSFYFVACNFGSDDILRAVAVENCRIFHVSGSTLYFAKSQLSPPPASLCCQGAGYQARWASGFSLPPTSLSSLVLTAKSRFSTLLTSVGRYGFTVSQDPLSSCMVEQRGNSQTIPGFTSFPHWQTGLLAQALFKGRDLTRALSTIKLWHYLGEFLGSPNLEYTAGTVLVCTISWATNQAASADSWVGQMAG